ncbi:MAG: hypothetical protein ACRD5B_10925, partial [Nitrososphaeraceae archaeon]
WEVYTHSVTDLFWFIVPFLRIFSTNKFFLILDHHKELRMIILYTGVAFKIGKIMGVEISDTM